MTALTGATASLWWLARWMLVLALIWDQVGSPLHTHRHDSGVDAGWTQAQLHDDPRHVEEHAQPGPELAAQHHVDEQDHAAPFAHAVLAVRTQAEQGAGSAERDVALAFDPRLHVVGTPVSGSSALSVPPDSVVAYGYRSLPPEGRAPPLHA